MGDSILDWVTGPGFGQLLGFSPAAAATMPQPQQPPAPPPNIMANAPASFAPNSSFDGGGLPFNQRFSPGPEPSAPMPSFADRAEPAESAIRNGDFDPQGRNFTPYTPSQALPFAEETPPTPPAPIPPSPPQSTTQPPPPPQMPPGQPVRNLQSQIAWNAGQQPVVNRTPRNGPSEGLSSTVIPGGLAASLGATRLTPEQQRTRAIGDALMGLGKGLSAVGQLKPGTTGAASFAAGAGGALEGSGHHADTNLDRDIKGKEHEAALALRQATLAENQRYHTGRLENEQARTLARMTGGPGGRDFQFDHKYNAWLAVHKDDHEGALDYANGHKKMDPAEQHKAALTLAQQMLRDQLRHEKDNPDGPQSVSRMTMEERQRYLDSLVEDNRRRLRGENAYRPPPKPVAVDPDRGLLPQPPQPQPSPVPPGPGKITPSYIPQNPAPPPTATPAQPSPSPPAPLGSTPAPRTPATPAPTPASPAPVAPPAATPPPATVPKSAAPPRPKDVPPKSAWSDARQMWRSPDGKLFDKDGKQVSGQ